MKTPKEVFSSYGLSVGSYINNLSLEKLCGRPIRIYEPLTVPNKQDLLDAALEHFFTSHNEREIRIADVKKFKESFHLSEEWLRINENLLTSIPLKYYQSKDAPSCFDYNSIMAKNSFHNGKNEFILEELSPSYALKKLFEKEYLARRDAIEEVKERFEKLSLEIEKMDLNPLKMELLGLFIQQHNLIGKTIQEILSNAELPINNQ